MAAWCVQRVLLASDEDYCITQSTPFLSSRFCQCLPNEKQNNSQLLAVVTNFYMQNYFYSWPGVQRPDHDYMVLHQSSGSFWIYAPLVALARNSAGVPTSRSPHGSDKNGLHSTCKVWSANWQPLDYKAALFHLSSHDQPLKSGSAIMNHWGLQEG